MATRRTKKTKHATSRSGVSFPFVTRQQLAVAFRKDARTIARWLEEGLPLSRRGTGGKPSLYHLPACIAWMLQHELAGVVKPEGDKPAEGLNPNAERALLDRSKRAMADFQLQVKRGEYVPVADVQAEYADIAATVKARLRAIPDTIATRVCSLAPSGPAAVKALLLTSIDSALRELVRAHREAEAAAIEGVADEAEEHDEVTV